MTITKAHIVEHSSPRTFPKDQSAQVIDTLSEMIKQSLQNGEEVLISGLGKFSVKESRRVWAGIPGLESRLTPPTTNVVTYKCSGILRAAMNGKGD